MTAQQWATYCITCLAAGMLPGPVTLLALATGARHGVVQALPAAAGNVAASVLQAMVSLALVGVVMDSDDGVFRVMLLVGGGYLVWLGIGLARNNPFRVIESAMGQAATLRARGFVDMFIVTLTNPKAILFFVALFPHIIPRDGGSMILWLALIAIVAAVAVVCFVTYATLGTAIRLLVRSPAVTTAIGLLLAVIFVGLGCVSMIRAVSA